MVYDRRKELDVGKAVIRISLPYIFELANSLELLSRLPDEDVPFQDIFFDLFQAENTLRSLIQSSLFSPYLRVSFQLAQTMMGAIQRETGPDKTYTRTIARYELWVIKNSYAQYRTALLAELGSLNSYFVTQKGGYDTVTLLMFGENLFPADLVSKVPEAIVDAKEAAKCLAFEMSTACGFHAFRATESVLRRYHAHVTGGAAPPKLRTLGVYIKSLTSSGHGDPKVLAALKQMTDLHRNPIAHPEAILTTEEAISILGVARSAIGAMLAALPVIPPTTATPLTTP